ncbi:TetR/AcrR family transcriptional regulator [Jiella endophytica]|uniref:TetR/AcrR family transcriptional regulator n=1 Tax=Jiella endophytica TaxID=2558362 RepID=A0A4Y8RH78_9HYPH|nr:TetR/AcrR family transcriptional regulator [Jiella endophytica]TFF22102.1 TetR/AcrR family transcriptional regulator [Jiella endophytica]
MSNARRKQPEVVRRRLLDCAEALAVERGLAGITVQAVADAAGVTKGGLFHHFPTKQALVEGMVADLLHRLDREIDAAIEKDPEPRGSFTRAYVDSVFVGREFGFDTPWAALSVAMVAEPHLRRLWAGWLDERQHRHQDTDDDPMLEVVRLAVDGAWLSVTIREGEAASDIAELRQRLIGLTRR